MTAKNIDRLGLRAERDCLGATWIDPRPWKQRVPAMGKRSHPQVSPELGKAKVPRQHYLPLSDQQTAGTSGARLSGRAADDMSKARKQIAKPKTLLDLESNDCRWPIGEPRQPDFHFCGKPHAPGRPYCELHWSMAFQPPRPRHQRPAIQPPTAPAAKAA